MEAIEENKVLCATMGLSLSDFYDLTPLEAEKYIKQRQQYDYDLAYYTAITTAQATMGKENPKRPTLGRTEQMGEKQLLTALIALKERGSG